MRRFVCLASAIVIGAAAEVGASLIQTPFIAARDSSMVGNVVASPTNGGSILLVNPAGVVGEQGWQAEAGVFAFRSDVDYENPAIDYKTSSSELVAIPTVWLGTGAFAPWHVGLGLYGTTGASFNFAGNPSAGFPNRFFSELAVMQLGLVAGREIASGLRVGIELSPTYSKIRARFPSPAGAVRFETDGMGIGGTAGVLYDLTPELTLGLAYRSPAIVYLRGDGKVGETRTDADIDLHLPQSVAFGFAYRLTERLTLNGTTRWTDYTQFEDGKFEFDEAPFLDQPLLRSTRATFRYGAALEYTVTETSVLRGGFSREEWMIEEAGMSPLLVDNSDILIGGGIGIDWDPLAVDVMVGVPYSEDRLVSADEQPAFPGRYEQEGLVFGVNATYRF